MVLIDHKCYLPMIKSPKYLRRTALFNHPILFRSQAIFKNVKIRYGIRDDTNFTNSQERDTWPHSTRAVFIRNDLWRMVLSVRYTPMSHMGNPVAASKSSWSISSWPASEGAHPIGRAVLMDRFKPSKMIQNLFQNIKNSKYDHTPVKKTFQNKHHWRVLGLWLFCREHFLWLCNSLHL